MNPILASVRRGAIPRRFLALIAALLSASALSGAVLAEDPRDILTEWFRRTARGHCIN
jgi:hypothetical protein